MFNWAPTTPLDNVGSISKNDLIVLILWGRIKNNSLLSSAQGNAHWNYQHLELTTSGKQDK